MIIGTLERFDAEITCIDKTQKAVKDAIMKEYERIYKIRNDGIDPRKEHSYRDDASDYKIAKEEIYIREIDMGEVFLL